MEQLKIAITIRRTKWDTGGNQAEVIRDCAGHDVGDSGDKADIKEANRNEEATSNIHSLKL